jgi:vancomycin permeability regulator SanA
MRKSSVALGVAGCVIAGILLSIGLSIRFDLRDTLYRSAADAPARAVVLVPGAEVYRDGRPSPALASRLDVAAALYRAGKVRTVLMSGGQGAFEVDAMTAYVIRAGVPATAVARDPNGERTYDSCANARDRFGIRSLAIVSQEDHVARAVYTCRRLGLDAIGVTAEEFTGDRYLVYRLREPFAMLLAWWQVNVSPPR